MQRYLQSVLTLQQGVGRVRHRAAIRDQKKLATAQGMGTRGDDRSLRANAEAIRQDQSRPLAFLRAPGLEFCFQTTFDVFAVVRALEAFPTNQNEIGTTRLYDHGCGGVFHPLHMG